MAVVHRKETPCSFHFHFFHFMSFLILDMVTSQIQRSVLQGAMLKKLVHKVDNAKLHTK